MSIEKLKVGESYLLPDPSITDFWEHSFEGTLIGYRLGNAQIQDSEGNVFECEPERLLEPEEPKTRVFFLYEQDNTNDVFAYFPDMIHNGDTMTAYSHVGQHGPCHPDYAKNCKEAVKGKYLGLYNELVGRGYILDIQNTKQ